MRTHELGESGQQMRWRALFFYFSKLILPATRSTVLRLSIEHVLAIVGEILIFAIKKGITLACLKAWTLESIEVWLIVDW